MFSNARRKRSIASINNDSTGKRKRNRKIGMITENTLLPVRILSCHEGNLTSRGTGTLQFSFQHLVSKEEFTSTVFENSAPAYIDYQIVEAVLPSDVEDYSLEDLVDQGLFVYVKFRTKGDRTYINVIQAETLSSEYQQVLEELLEEEKYQHHEADDMAREMEKALEDEEDDDLDLDIED